MATTHLGFEDNQLLDRLAGLLRDHDYLHDEVERLGTEHPPPAPEPPEFAEVSIQITANIRELASILGLRGLHGLVHIVDEALLEIGIDGLDLTDPENVADIAALLSIPNDITKSLAVIAAFDGKIPSDPAEREAKLDELLAEEHVAFIQLG